MKKPRYKKHQERQFRRKRFDNPYFSKKHPNRFKTLATISGLLAIVIGISWLLIWLPFLSIKTVKVSGTITTPPSEVENITWTFLHENIWNFIPRSHRWFLDEKEVSTRIKDRLHFQSVQVKHSGNELSIHVTETVSPFIWARGDQLYYIDQEGSISRSLREDEAADVRAIIYQEGERTNILQTNQLYIIFDDGEEEVSQNISVLSDESVGGLHTLVDQLEQNGFEIDGLITQRIQPLWITVRLKNGFDIYVDLIGEVEPQIERFLAVVQERGGDMTDVSYVDLRFGNRVFVK